MERIPLPAKIDPELADVLKVLMDSDFEVIELGADVTTTGGELKVNQRGFNPTTKKLFFNFSGNTYSVTLTLTA